MKKLAALALMAGCQFSPARTPLSPPDIAASTFRVEASGVVEDEQMTLWSGTAWIQRNEEGFSHLITAGHVCDTTDVEDFATDVKFGLRDRFGNYYPAIVLRKSEDYDLCEMMAADLGPALELAQHMPGYDEPIVMVGAPLGVYGCDNAVTGETSFECGMAPISRGFFGGGTLVSMPSVGGNSGSAVLSQDGVFGVLVSGYRGFDSLNFVEPLSHVNEFLSSK